MALHLGSVEAAQRVLAEMGVRGPRDIHVPAIAERYGALVLYGRVETARAWLIRTQRHAIVHIDERFRDTPRARFCMGHELGHHLLHPMVDHLSQCISVAPRPGRAWQLERQANDFATELLTPEWLAAPLCQALIPTPADLERLARTFRTSLEMSALRYVQLTGAPCAVVSCEGGRVKWAVESATFPGRIIQRRDAHPATDAARAASGVLFSSALPREVPGDAWGGTTPFLEQALTRWGSSGVLSWIVPV